MRFRLAAVSSAIAFATTLGGCADAPEPVGPAHPGPVADVTQAPLSGTLVITSNTTLTEDHYGNVLIDANDVTLDCAGHTVYGPGVSGFSGGINVGYLRTGVIVTRCAVTGFNVNGIWAGGASNNRYEANLVYGNGANGIALDDGSGNVVVGNTSRSNGGIGIVFTRMTQSRIEADTATGNANWAGIALLDGCHDNEVVNNTATGNAIGFVVDNATGNELRGNTANSNNSHGFTIIRGANGNVFESNTANLNVIGFEITEASNANTIRSNVANKNTFEGFKVYKSDGNTFTGNTGNRNGSFGFLVFGGSSYNALTRNVGRNNASVDAYDEGTGTGNVWTSNTFGTTAGI